MKAGSYITIALGIIVAVFGLLSVNLGLVVLGLVGVLVGRGMVMLMAFDTRVARMESQLRIIISTQRDPGQKRPAAAIHDSATEEQAWDYLKPD